MSKFDLHLVSWNRPKMTELVIRTIHRNTKPDNFRLVVFDNGSEKQTTDMLELLHDNGLIDELHRSMINIGLEGARQALFNKLDAGARYFICVDNDCLPPPMIDGQDWIDRLVDLMEKYEDYAAIACRTQVMIGTGNIFEDENKELTDFPHPGGSLRIMRASAVREVGGWDRESDGRGAEERYICGKLRDAGYKTAFATHIPTLHLFGTRGENGTDRWGYPPNWKPEDTGHSDVFHPALEHGDDPEEIKKYAGEELTNDYYNY